MNLLFRCLKGVKRQRNLESLPREGRMLEKKKTVESRVQNAGSKNTFIQKTKMFWEKLAWLSGTAGWARRYKLEALKIYCWLPSRGVSWLSLRVELGLLSVQRELFLITLHMLFATFSFIFSMLHNDLSLCKGLFFPPFLLKSISKNSMSATPT